MHQPQDHTNGVDGVAAKCWLCRSKGNQLRQVSNEHLHESWILNMLIWYTMGMAKYLSKQNGCRNDSEANQQYTVTIVTLVSSGCTYV